MTNRKRSELSRNTLVEAAEQGVVLPLVDQDGPTMVAEASAQPNERFASLTGKGDTEPMITDNPYLPYNRRVGFVLKADAPPLSFGASP
jgi:flagellar motor protein MotB